MPRSLSRGESLDELPVLRNSGDLERRPRSYWFLKLLEKFLRSITWLVTRNRYQLKILGLVSGLVRYIP